MMVTMTTQHAAPAVIVCHCDGSSHALGNEEAVCIYSSSGALRPAYREIPANAAPRMSFAAKRALSERSRSYSNAVRNYNH